MLPKPGEGRQAGCGEGQCPLNPSTSCVTLKNLPVSVPCQSSAALYVSTLQGVGSRGAQRVEGACPVTQPSEGEVLVQGSLDKVGR